MCYCCNFLPETKWTYWTDTRPALFHSRDPRATVDMFIAISSVNMHNLGPTEWLECHEFKSCCDWWQELQSPSITIVHYFTFPKTKQPLPLSSLFFLHSRRSRAFRCPIAAPTCQWPPPSLFTATMEWTSAICSLLFGSLLRSGVCREANRCGFVCWQRRSGNKRVVASAEWPCPCWDIGSFCPKCRSAVAFTCRRCVHVLRKCYPLARTVTSLVVFEVPPCQQAPQGVRRVDSLSEAPRSLALSRSFLHSCPADLQVKHSAVTQTKPLALPPHFRTTSLLLIVGHCFVVACVNMILFIVFLISSFILLPYSHA